MAVAQGLGKGEMELLCNGHRVSAFKMEKVQDCGKFHNMGRYLMLLNHKLRDD